MSTDPEFAARAADVIGLYLVPPTNALVAKNLSANNICLEMYFSECDYSGGEVVECEEAALKFFIAHQ